MATPTAIQNALKGYMATLFQMYDTLSAEKANLQNAAVRLPQIDAEQADLVAEAQSQLAKYNAANGTAITLAQLRTILFGSAA